MYFSFPLHCCILSGLESFFILFLIFSVLPTFQIIFLNLSSSLMNSYSIFFILQPFFLIFLFFFVNIFSTQFSINLHQSLLTSNLHCNILFIMSAFHFRLQWCYFLPVGTHFAVTSSPLLIYCHSCLYPFLLCNHLPPNHLLSLCHPPLPLTVHLLCDTAGEVICLVGIKPSNFLHQNAPQKQSSQSEYL